MDRAHTGDGTVDQKHLSEIYCACTRGMLFICFINELIPNGWMTFFAFTETVSEAPSSVDNHTSSDATTNTSDNVPQKNASLVADMPSSSSIANDAERERNEVVPIGVANRMFEGQQVFNLDTFQERENEYGRKTDPQKVKMLGQTTIFDITKPPMKSMEDVPGFYPLKPTGSGISEEDPYVYDGGTVPNVYFIDISPNIPRIDDYAFLKNDRMEQIVIPNHVTHIGEYTFYNCTNFKKVAFEEPSSLVEIGSGAFFECSKIEEIKLPASLETLGENAFQGCSGMRKVTLSPNMTTIDPGTFSDCSSLTSVEGMHSITTIREGAFSGCSSLQSIDVNATTDIHEYAFWNCNASINHIKEHGMTAHGFHEGSSGILSMEENSGKWNE